MACFSLFFYIISTVVGGVSHSGALSRNDKTPLNRTLYGALKGFLALYLVSNSHSYPSTTHQAFGAWRMVATLYDRDFADKEW